MAIKSYSKYVYYFKSLGTCIFIFGGCWLVYQVRETSQLLRSTLATNVLNLEQNQAHYIYLDSHQKDIYIYNSGDPAEGKPSSLLNVVTKWWTSLNQSIAYRHFNVAKNGTKNQRMRAVYYLGTLKHLQSWNYQHIAQMMDSRTAVALARISDSDLRFFLKPPYHFVDKKLYEIIDQLYQLLVDMDKLCQSGHSCLIHFLHKKFYSSRKNLEFDHELSSTDFTATPTISWDEQLLMQCIEAIYHHTSIEQFSRNLADAHGLSALMEVKKKFADNIDVCVLLAKIISNLSMHSELLDVIFQSGWIGVLAAWSRDKDIRLAGPAARALFNLDEDANNGEKFPRRIYLLHPMNRTRSEPKADVVFIHGLLGGVFISWRQRDPDPSLKVVEPRRESEDLLINIVKEYPQEFIRDLAHDLQIRDWKKIGHDYEIILHDCPVSMNSLASGPFTCPGNEICTEYQENYLTRTECWPKDWLPNDVPSVRVIGINYDTSLSWWSPPCPIEILRSTISERSIEFTKKLVIAGVGKRPIIWVCHSMGGLLVKQMLVEESKTGDKHRLCDNTKGIIFYSTPHRGSHVATLKQTTQMLLWPSVEVQELREESPQLLKLHEEFIKMLDQYKMEIVSFSETKSTFVSALKVPLQIKFVLPESADPGVGEFYEIPQDHLSICKPASKHSFLYRKIVDVLKKMITDNNN